MGQELVVNWLVERKPRSWCRTLVLSQTTLLSGSDIGAEDLLRPARIYKCQHHILVCDRLELQVFQLRKDVNRGLDVAVVSARTEKADEGSHGKLIFAIMITVLLMPEFMKQNFDGDLK